ncbi:Protein ccc1 [Tilletia horrida]|nr:Protein ccc1 [Tilletia horrida]
MPCQNCSCSSSKQESAPAVPLPRQSYGSSESSPLLWKTTPSSTAADSTPGTPIASSSSPACDRHSLVRRGRTQCCKELNDAAASSSSNPTFIDPDVVRDVIIGLSDGLSVPFALSAALTALGSTRIVVVGGIAELVSGAISMGVGGFLSAQAEMEHYNNQARHTHERVSRSCLAEMKREVAAILEPFGLGDDVAEKVAERLARVEQAETSTGEGLPAPVIAANADHEGSSDISAPEQGLTPFLLKLGHGLEPVSPSRAYISAATIGVSYFLGGLVPLIPYMIWPRVGEALIGSIVITGIVLLVFGAVKHRFTGGKTTVGAYTWAAVSTLSVGGIAAAASWSIVRAIEGHE